MFVSYRRADSGAIAGRLYDRLVREFGKARVFMDIEGGIAHGADFPAEIERALAATSALVVVIGRHWMTCTDADGTPRIGKADDWVANEVATALDRNIFILPVLVDGASMPEGGVLPSRLAALSRRQACDIRPATWEYDVSRVIDALRPSVPLPFWKTRRGVAFATLSALVFGLLASMAPNLVAPGPTREVPPARLEPPPAAQGEITLEWHGSSRVQWDVIDEHDNPVKREVAPAGGIGRVSVPPGRYFVALRSLPEHARMPVTVAAGATAALTPGVGQLRLRWSGSSPTTVSVEDGKQTVLREKLSIPASGTLVVDLAPGTYMVVQTGPRRRTVRVIAGTTVELRLGPEPAPPTPLPVPYVAGQWKLPAGELLGFVEVPAGRFVMGSDRARDVRALQDELPQHEVALPAFFIGRYEVTVDQYKACVDDGGCRPGEAAALSGAPFMPVRFISWNEAAAYCAWLDSRLRSWSGTPARLAAALNGERDGREWRVRLPTEAEWEKAARGTDGRVYPWGDASEVSRANYAEGGRGEPRPVGSYPTGASPNGLLDMSGNVWEWTRSRLHRYPYDISNDTREARSDDNTIRVMRGGSFQTVDIRVARRNTAKQGERTDFTGFRIVVAPPP